MNKKYRTNEDHSAGLQPPKRWLGRVPGASYPSEQARRGPCSPQADYRTGRWPLPDNGKNNSKTTTADTNYMSILPSMSKCA